MFMPRNVYVSQCLCLAMFMPRNAYVSKCLCFTMFYVSFFSCTRPIITKRAFIQNLDYILFSLTWVSIMYFVYTWCSYTRTVRIGPVYRVIATHLNGVNMSKSPQLFTLYRSYSDLAMPLYMTKYL
ncbi:hypothetical protein DFP73DRAFT_396435 [Morchella snyderi]|nr:hypothetical protein DFP73DRAFT_396435 [Morchella snyderi]